MSRDYYRILLGRKNVHAAVCREQGFIGGDWGFRLDLSNRLPENWKDFNREFIPIYLKDHPDKSKIAAGLACGMLHRICKGIQVGDIILSPDGSGSYHVGEVVSEYYYEESDILPHRRKVQWYHDGILRNAMSQELKNSAGSVATVSNISKHAAELEELLRGNQPVQLIVNEESVEDPIVFALEKHLEDFLVRNWAGTELGKEYDIFEDEGELVGQQYPSDTGPIDILAVSKDKKTLLVVELKRGRASDVVVGQIQRYMGYVLDELAESDQAVKGIIIALEDDQRLKRALRVTSNIDFYRYEVNFKLLPSSQ